MGCRGRGVPCAPSHGERLRVTKLIARFLEVVASESHQPGHLFSRLLLGIEEGDYVGAQDAFAGALSMLSGNTTPTWIWMGTLTQEVISHLGKRAYSVLVSQLKPPREVQKCLGGLAKGLGQLLL